MKNIPVNTTVPSLLEGFAQFQPVTAKLFNLSGAEEQVSSKSFATIRFRSVPGHVPAVDKMFKEVSSFALPFTKNSFPFRSQSIRNNAAFQISDPVLMNKPVIYLRNIKHLDEGKIAKLLENHPSQRIQYIRTSKDGFLDMAIAYFSSEEKALKCLTELRETCIDGKRLTLAYR